MTSNDSLQGTRCQDCVHFTPCYFDDLEEARETLGYETVSELMGLYGTCSYDAQNPSIVSSAAKMYDRWGYECWNGN